MTDPDQVRKTVTRVLAQVFEERMPELRDEIARRVLRELQSVAPAPVPGPLAVSQDLNEALASIQGSSSQAEILSALLDGLARFNGRAALFVVRGAAAQGWQARGLLENEAIKGFALDTSAGLAARAVQTRVPATGPSAEFDSHFFSAFGTPIDGNSLVLPLVVRDKVAALIYSDAGTLAAGSVDASAAELLVRAAAVWIELSIVRRSAPPPAAEPPVARAAAVSAGAPSVEVAASASSPAVPEPPAVAVPVQLETAAPIVVPSTPEPAIPPEEDELHRKARRFAKLLVEEIKLYNQAQVAEGRLKEDLYERLKNDIDKSRASYEKRYGQSAAASADYFTQELIRILADGNSALLGSTFPR